MQSKYTAADISQIHKIDLTTVTHAITLLGYSKRLTLDEALKVVEEVKNTKHKKITAP